MDNEATPRTPSGLTVKLANILGEVGKVPKSGHNDFHKYDYVTENDLVYAVRERLSLAGIFVFTSCEDQKVQIIEDTNAQGVVKKSILTLVTLRHTFVDGETGERFSVLSQGQGSDVGDKGGYKAITGAMKYFIYKCFMIPTGDDPEADRKTDERGAGSAGASARVEADLRREDRAATAARIVAEAPRATPVSKPAAVATAKPAAAKLAAIAVPRDRSEAPDNPDMEPAPGHAGAWAEVIFHFGKHSGTRLGDMKPTDLAWWCANYEAKPYNGKLSPRDIALRKALDEWSAEQGN